MHAHRPCCNFAENHFSSHDSSAVQDGRLDHYRSDGVSPSKSQLTRNWAVANQFLLQGLFAIFGIAHCVSTHYGDGRHIILVTNTKLLVEVNIVCWTKLSEEIYTDQTTFAFSIGVPRYRMRLPTLYYCY